MGGTGDTDRVNGEFVHAIASLLPDDDGDGTWFVMSRDEAHTYLMSSLSDIASGDGRFASGVDGYDEQVKAEIADVHVSLYMLMTGRASTVAMTHSGRVVPYGVDWDALGSDAR